MTVRTDDVTSDIGILFPRLFLVKSNFYFKNVMFAFHLLQGKIESLHSLLYPSRRETKRGPMQYINTSAPVQLR